MENKRIFTLKCELSVGNGRPINDYYCKWSAGLVSTTISAYTHGNGFSSFKYFSGSF
jgi:hypothetical protein